MQTTKLKPQPSMIPITIETFFEFTFVSTYHLVVVPQMPQRAYLIILNRCTIAQWPATVAGCSPIAAFLSLNNYTRRQRLLRVLLHPFSLYSMPLAPLAYHLIVYPLILVVADAFSSLALNYNYFSWKTFVFHGRLLDCIRNYPLLHCHHLHYYYSPLLDQTLLLTTIGSHPLAHSPSPCLTLVLLLFLYCLLDKHFCSCALLPRLPLSVCAQPP